MRVFPSSASSPVLPIDTVTVYQYPFQWADMQSACILVASFSKLIVLLSFFSSRLKELNETHRKVEHEIKIAVFTLINEINKKGKSLLQQLEVREY